MFRMYLRVVSSTLWPEEISERLGAAPDSVIRRGTSRHPGTPPRDHSTWIREISGPAGPARPEELEHVVIGWGTPFAKALGALAGTGDIAVSLEIVQEIRHLDDPREKGIFLTADLLSWLAIAGASLDIDQYVFHDCAD